jgi:hypothetical protein
MIGEVGIIQSESDRVERMARQGVVFEGNTTKRKIIDGNGEIRRDDFVSAPHHVSHPIREMTHQESLRLKRKENKEREGGSLLLTGLYRRC